MAFDYDQIAEEVFTTHAVGRDISFIHHPGDDVVYESMQHDHEVHEGFSVELKNPEIEGPADDKLVPLPTFVSGLNSFVVPGEPMLESHLLAAALWKEWNRRLPARVGVQE